MDEQVNPLERDHSLCVVLPGGLKKNITVHGSKPVMDLLVTLCASYHLNPSDYTVEFLSPNKNSISFKPNFPIGSLEAEVMVLKPKGTEEKTKRPYMPEATVRLLVNYNRSHKTVVRVSPSLPLEMLLPVVCDKCEFDVGTTVLLKEAQSTEPLDLTRTLNDYGLREVFAISAAKDSMDNQLRAAETADVISLPLIQDSPRKEKKPKDRGFFSFFRRKKKKHEAGSVSAPVSPGVGKRLGVGVNSDNVSSASTLPADLPKKRRAPQPPVGASQSVPNNLSTCCGKGAQGSAESTIRSTKRRAPPPPCATTQVESLNSLEELRETDQTPHPSQPSFSSRPSRTHLHEVADPFLSSLRGRDLSDARCALAKVLTSSLSNGMLVKRLRNSAANFYVSSCVSMASDRPDDGEFCVEHESVLKSDLPTENEWDDPLHRSRLTTFKVVPPKKPTACDSEETVAISSQDQGSTEDGSAPEVSLENENDETAEGALCSSSEPGNGMSPNLDFHQMKNSSAFSAPPHDLDDQINSVIIESQKEEAEAPSEVIRSESSDCCDEEVNGDHRIKNEDEQSPSSDMEPCSSSIDDKKAEEDVQDEEEEEASFPPPPPPVFFKEDVEKGASTSSSQPSDPPMNGHTNAQENRLSESELSQDKTKVGQSRFAQAVAMAVQRSRLQSLNEDLGSRVHNKSHGALPSPSRSTYQHGPEQTLAHWSDSIQL